MQVKGFTEMKGSGLAQGDPHTLTKRPLIIRDFHIFLIWEQFKIDARRKKNKETSIWKFPQWLNNTAEMAFARLNRHAPLDPKYCSETNSPSIVQSLTGVGIPTIKLWSNSSNSSGVGWETARIFRSFQAKEREGSWISLQLLSLKDLDKAIPTQQLISKML